jgi:protein phosphatase 1L
MWIANVGDSRAVVCKRGAANQLTVDHEPHTSNERQRIEKHGGFVTTFPGTTLLVLLFGHCREFKKNNCLIILYVLLTGDVPRVNGQLAVARAFGDQSLKAHLSSEPDIKHVPINSSTEFVVLASDGLWKVSTKITPFNLFQVPLRYPRNTVAELFFIFLL